MTADGFGYKTAWVAARSVAPEVLASALALRDLQESAWQAGVEASYGDGRLVFVTPRLGDWTLCTGVALLDATSGRPAEFPDLLQKIAARLETPVQFWIGWMFYFGAFSAARHRSTNMNTLIAVGTSAAYIYSVIATFFPSVFEIKGYSAHVYFDTAAAIIVLILLGRLLEARAKGHTSEAIKKLMGLQARTARVLRGAEERDVPIEDVEIGDTVILRPGEKIPVDGVVREVGEQARVGGMGAAGRHHDRVTVGRGSDQDFGADDGVAAGAVVHKHLLAPAFGQFLADKTGR